MRSVTTRNSECRFVECPDEDTSARLVPTILWPDSKDKSWTDPIDSLDNGEAGYSETRPSILSDSADSPCFDPMTQLFVPVAERRRWIENIHGSSDFAPLDIREKNLEKPMIANKTESVERPGSRAFDSELARSADNRELDSEAVDSLPSSGLEKRRKYSARSLGSEDTNETVGSASSRFDWKRPTDNLAENYSYSADCPCSWKMDSEWSDSDSAEHRLSDSRGCCSVRAARSLGFGSFEHKCRTR